MMEQFNNIFMDEIYEYIKNNMLDDVYEYDEFYDALFERVTERINLFEIEMNLKKHNYLTIECVLEMCKLIRTTFGIEDFLNFSYSYVMMSYLQFLVSENGADLYQFYKEECVSQKTTDQPVDVILDECSICYEEKLLNTTMCNHTFCTDCLFKIDTCAMCRTELVETFTIHYETFDDDEIIETNDNENVEIPIITITLPDEIENE